MTTTADQRHTVDDGASSRPAVYDEQVAALTASYHRTVDHIMTNRYGRSWAARGDLPDEAYMTETTFYRWLNDLLDHIDHAAGQHRQIR
jgi:hypothetical protein